MDELERGLKKVGVSSLRIDGGTAQVRVDVSVSVCVGFGVGVNASLYFLWVMLVCVREREDERVRCHIVLPRPGICPHFFEFVEGGKQSLAENQE